MATKRELLQKLLKGIETGDAESAAVVNEEKYIQHNPQTHEGSEGLAVLFKRLSKTNPRVSFIRVFEDGDFAFAHNEYDFSTLRVAFEVFRFEDGKAVEHWDNIQKMEGPNPSGRGMLSGPTDITDLHLTETNRALVRAFVEQVLVGREYGLMTTYVADDLHQHSPRVADGVTAYTNSLAAEGAGASSLSYNALHMVLAEGNFVLSVSEGHRDGIHSSFYDLFRINGGVIVEHWDTVEALSLIHI